LLQKLLCSAGKTDTTSIALKGCWTDGRTGMISIIQILSDSKLKLKWQG